MHVDKLNVQLRQEIKWGELDVFFKTNSQYYKQIDNDEVVFIVGIEGTDFIANLFLNDLEKTINNDRITSGLIWDCIKYTRQGPEPWFDDYIIWDSPGHFDPKQHTTLSPESFEILKSLNISETLSYNIDTNLKNFFSNDKTLNGTRYFITRILPVIAYFYYKNFEKVKIILIDITDVNLFGYIEVLDLIRKSHGIGNSAMLSRKSGRTTLEAWAEEHELYSVLDSFTALKKVIGDNEYTNGIFLDAMINNQWIFINQIEKTLNCLCDLNNVKSLYIDINHNLSSNCFGGMMDFPIFADQLYKIDYRKLFFEQNRTDVKQIMDLFNAKFNIAYYIGEVQRYNAINIKLKQQIEKELVISLEKLKERYNV